YRDWDFVLTTKKAIIREFEAPSFYTESTDNGILLKLDKFIVDIHADMEFSLKNLFFGLPIWPLSKFNIGPKIWFPSKIPFFFDIFGGVINRVVQNLLRTEICNSLENVVKPSIFGEHSFPVETQYGDRREYLVQTPLFNVLHTENFSEAQFAFDLQFLREKCPYEPPRRTTSSIPYPSTKSNGSLATLVLTFSCDLSGRLNRTVLLGGISNIQADIRQTHSVIGYLYPERLQTFKKHADQ
ncbi:unnamed protein product, partial [Mesorhabditis spiculigera]